MGSWGSNNFSNDDARDWFPDIAGWQDVQEPLARSVTGVEGCSETECSIALAAAELVAGALSGDLSRLPADVRDWVSLRRTKPDKSLVALAVQAVTEIATASKLQRLTDEGGRNEEWHRVQESLVALLRRSGSST
jgi:hypothetical protein